MRRHLLPLMRRHGVNLWIVMSRENAAAGPGEGVRGFGEGRGTAVPGWGNQLVSMQREEDAITSKTAPLRYLAGPQTELWIVK
jgi:hypothetical protein